MGFKCIYNKEDGQALIQVSIAIIVLLGFAALAIDGGLVYSERRQMQNAADAGALAGAREICFGVPANAVTVARQYAITNGADSADVTIENDWHVVVTTTHTANLFLAGVVGVTDPDIRASASAACGAANQACGLWPVAFHAEEFNDVYDEGAGCGQRFYVWSDDKEPIDCEIYNCDFDGDGIDDLFGGGDRGWLDFSDVVDPEYPDQCTQDGCGASELACHIARDVGAVITLPACVPGDSGVKAGVKSAVDSRINDSVGIALYESINQCTGGRSCPGGNTYYVTSFGCVKVIGWEQSLKVDHKDGKGNKVGKAIVVELDCDGCTSTCGGTDGSPPVPGGIKTVNLLK